MLFVDDFIADRQSKPSALARRLRAEKRLEKLVPDLSGNAVPVVPHPHLNVFANISRGYRQRRSEFPIVGLSPALIRGVEGIAEEIEEHARHFLGHERDQSDLLPVGSVYRDFKFLILSAGAVIGEIERVV